MPRKIRYGDYLGQVRVRQITLSYNQVTAYDAQHRQRMSLRPRDAWRLISPYVSVRFLEQFRAVFPLALFLVLFQFLALRAEVAGSGGIVLGLVVVMLGLMLFMEGLKHG